ncbi:MULTISPECIES: aminodeoxychorismate lyase [Vibrio]|uniref:Aminodeoxychorismate lyase n=1 Tax=Vibrio casei TaxID=673372 RepID=A0A368LM45_9VIBR|nr:MULTISPECIES: aminodeoxychorismate lyase [Vibrio]RCS72964.1 aminodeoxychorismate lyase [Vibrio casei]SJN32693.1 Aminodeoxychorismate lyase [Vibrio casei]HBV75353.1 aminodeoxychorismate lyase [Vibrio sp.]
MYLVNGQQTNVTSLGDRSFNYGDGCFSTILVKSGRVDLWALHQKRMSEALQRLFIEEPDWDCVLQWIADAISIHHSDFVPYLSGIKLHVSRGTGGRGYSPFGVNNPQVTIHPFDYPEHYTRWKANGIHLGLSSVHLGLNPLLAGLKHNNRLEQILIKAEMETQPFDDSVVLDINQNVIETSASNLFWVKNDILYTANLSQSGVAGIMRAYILERASTFGLNIHVGSYTLTEFMNADEVFTTNALHSVVPVIGFENHFFEIGVLTRTLQEKINP